MSNLRKLLSTSVGESLAKGLNFLTVIGISFFVTVEEYGAFGLVVAFLLITTSLVNFGQDRFALRFAGKYHLIPIAISCLVITLCFALIFGFVAGVYFYVFNGNTLKISISEFLILVSVLYIGSVLKVFQSILRANLQFDIYVTSRLLYQFLKLLLLLMFILYAGVSAPIALLYTEFISLFLSVLYVVKSKSILLTYKFNRKVTFYGFLYGFPFLVHSVAGNVLGFIDRFMLNDMMSLYDVGVYNFYYTVSSSIVFFYAIINIIAEPLVFKAKDKKLCLKSAYKKYFITISSFGFVGAVVLFFTVKFMFFYGVLEQYKGHEDLFIILLSSFVAYSVYLLSILKVTVEGMIRFIPMLTMLTLIINIVMNYYLIAHLGLLGAGVSTLVSTLFLSLGMFSISKLIKHNRNIV